MNYYTTIEAKKMDNHLVEMASQAVKGAGDGRISQTDAEKLLSALKDGNGLTEVETDTLIYIREHFVWTPAADEWFSNQFTLWKTGKPKTSMTPAQISVLHFSAKDVLHDEDLRKQRKHDLHTAMNETNTDHDDIGLIVKLASGERVEVLCNFIEMSGDFVELKGGFTIPVRAIERVEI